MNTGLLALGLAWPGRPAIRAQATVIVVLVAFPQKDGPEPGPSVLAVSDRLGAFVVCGPFQAFLGPRRLRSGPLENAGKGWKCWKWFRKGGSSGMIF